jgi:hypothetical protein
VLELLKLLSLLTQAQRPLLDLSDAIDGATHLPMYRLKGSGQPFAVSSFDIGQENGIVAR